MHFLLCFTKREKERLMTIPSVFIKVPGEPILPGGQFGYRPAK